MARPDRARSAGGFTLIELLVVIAMIAVVVGIVVPYLQKMREDANKKVSANNLRQMTLAAIDRYESWGNLPGYSMTFDNELTGERTFSSIFFAILPDLEDYAPLYEQGVAAADAKSVRCYWAPGDPTADMRASPGRSSYLCNAQVFPACNFITENPKPARFPVSIPDGPSQTIGFMEGYSRTAAGDRSWAYPINNYHPGNGGTFEMMPGYTSNTSTADPLIGQAFYRSGIQVSMMDGSARVCKPSLMTSGSFQLALTPAGGVPLGNDW